jgi:hypothetical protein
MLLAPERAVLRRLVQPIDDVLSMAGLRGPAGARNVVLREMRCRQTAFWAWDEPVWSSILGPSGGDFQVRVASSPACESTCSSSLTSSAGIAAYTGG